MAYSTFGHVGISFQQSFGTAFATSRDYFPILNESITEEIPPLISESIVGRFEEGDTYEGFHTIGGDLSMEVHPISIGKMMKAWTNNTSMTGQTSTYSHQFLPLQTDFDNKAAVIPCTIEIFRGVGSSFIYSDMLANTFSIEIAHGQITKSTIGFVGGNYVGIAETTPSYPAGSYYPFHVTSISMAGAAVDILSELTVMGTNTLEAKGYLDGTKTPARVLRTGFRTVEVNGTMIFEDQEQFKIFNTFATQRIIVSATGATIGDGKIDMTIDVPQMRYSAYPVNIAGAGIIEVAFTGRGEYNVASSYIVKYTVQNTKAAY